MFDDVTIRVSDRVASRRFYETLLGAPSRAGGELDGWDDFSVGQADDAHPVTRHLHVAFGAASPAEVDALWRRCVEAGYESDGEPGPRPQYSSDYYGGFLLDPDGNSAEAVHGVHPSGGGNRIDHLWIRVADLEASRRFWQTAAPPLGLELHGTTFPGRLFAVAARDRHFMLVEDERPRTEHVRLAFPADSPLRLTDPDGNVVEGVP